MKKVIFAYVLILLLGVQCEDQFLVSTVDDCVDRSPSQEDVSCYTEYRPVCGCDGKTYSNDCVAMQMGVNNWKEGQCP